MTSLAARVQYLVDEFHEGKVHGAALRIGVPPRTLANIVGGRAESPRAGALQQIADFHGTTIDWLMTGRGEAPVAHRDGQPPGGGPFLAWYRQVDQLLASTARVFEEDVRWTEGVRPSSLTTDDERELMRAALYSLALQGFTFALYAGTDVSERRLELPTVDALNKAVDVTPEMWRGLVARAVADEGSEQVIREMRRRLPDLVLGFGFAASVVGPLLPAWVYEMVLRTARSWLASMPHRAHSTPAPEIGTPAPKRPRKKTAKKKR